MITNWPVSDRRCENCEYAEREEGARRSVLIRCRSTGAGRRCGWIVGVLGRRNYAPAWCPEEQGGRK